MPTWSHDEMLEAIERIYDAVEDPEAWERAIRPIADAVNAHVAVLYLRGGDDPVGGEVLDDIVRGATERDFQRFRDYYAAIEPAAALAFEQAPGAFFSMESLGKGCEYRRSEFYNDFARPQGGARSTYAWAPIGEGRFAAVAYHREEQFGAFADAEREFLGRFLPHIAKALRIRDRIAASDRGRRHAIEVLSTAVLGIDRDGRVYWNNAAGERVLAAADGLSVHDGVLRAASQSEDRELHRCIGACLGGQWERVSSSSRVAITRASQRAPYRVDVLRVPESSDGSVDGLVFISIPDMQRMPDAQWLVRAFDLTRTEARIARRVAGGETLEQVAAVLGISVGTARNHLKRVFGKTGTSRQAELVWLLRRVSIIDEP